MSLTRFHILLLLLCAGPTVVPAQTDTAAAPTPRRVKFLSLENAPAFDKRRFWIGAGTGLGLYGGASVALWQSWYKSYPLTSFHTFNDMGEWMGMDKAGHLLSAHAEANYVFKGALWTGMDRRKALWTGVGVATGIQATIEIMDGFSSKWGFSIADMGFNVLGAGLFAVQQALWDEQRILMKVSSTRPAYPTEVFLSEDGGSATSLSERANQLYGRAPREVFFKDYNAMTVWASFNLRSFSKNKKESRLPPWLNLALGFGAGNIYGGFSNEWTSPNGALFRPDANAYPRYHQFYLAPDVDWSRLPTRHPWLKFALGFFNWIKIPGPVLEINTLGQMKFHVVYW